MTDRDAAFLWETEALRRARRRGEITDPLPAAAPPPQSWATLRDAHYRTGIPIETLRKWARRGTVASFLDESEIGVRRMVRMDSVHARAHDLGREIAPVARPAPTPRPAAAPPVDSVAAPAADPQPAPLDAPAGPAAPDQGRAAADDGAGGPPEGTMIVPIAAWDKMLMQLGNLHEAGQQLAEARERAAKAETEAAFLRERLGEMRRDLAATRARDAEHATTTAAPAADTDEGTPEPAPATTPPARTEKLWRYVYRGWRERRR